MARACLRLITTIVCSRVHRVHNGCAHQLVIFGVYGYTNEMCCPCQKPFHTHLMNEQRHYTSMSTSICLPAHVAGGAFSAHQRGSGPKGLPHTVYLLRGLGICSGLTSDGRTAIRAVSVCLLFHEMPENMYFCAIIAIQQQYLRSVAYGVVTRLGGAFGRPYAERTKPPHLHLYFLYLIIV